MKQSINMGNEWYVRAYIEDRGVIIVRTEGGNLFEKYFSSVPCTEWGYKEGSCYHRLPVQDCLTGVIYLQHRFKGASVTPWFGFAIIFPHHDKESMIFIKQLYIPGQIFVKQFLQLVIISFFSCNPMSG